MRRDRIISPRERGMMIQVGRLLDFDKRFCEGAMNELLKNPHIKDRPMKFEDQRTAISFLHHAISLALVDGEIHPRERLWLKDVAQENGLQDDWLDQEIQSRQEAPNSPDSVSQTV